MEYRALRLSDADRRSVEFCLGDLDILESIAAPDGLTRRCRQQPPRRAVDRFMKLEHHRCKPRLLTAAVPELGR